MRRVDFPLLEQAYQTQQAQTWDQHFAVVAWRAAGYDAAFAKHLTLLVRLFNLLSPAAPLSLTLADADQPHAFGGAWLPNAQGQGIYFRHASTIEGHAKEEGEFVMAGWAMLGLPGLFVECKAFGRAFLEWRPTGDVISYDLFLNPQIDFYSNGAALNQEKIYSFLHQEFAALCFELLA